MKGILVPGNCFQFPLVKFIVSKIAYTSLENTKNEHYSTNRKVAREIFSGTSAIILIKRFDGTDHTYQSHQLRTKSEV